MSSALDRSSTHLKRKGPHSFFALDRWAWWWRLVAAPGRGAWSRRLVAAPGRGAWSRRTDADVNSPVPLEQDVRSRAWGHGLFQERNESTLPW